MVGMVTDPTCVTQWCNAAEISIRQIQHCRPLICSHYTQIIGRAGAEGKVFSEKVGLIRNNFTSVPM